MTNNYNFHCVVSGKSFHPSAALMERETFVIEQMNDPGGMELVASKNSRNSSVTFEYGNLVLSPKGPTEANFESEFSAFLVSLKDFVDRLPRGEFDVLLQVNFAYESQCNFELSAALINKLSTLKATFALTCYEKD